jgi:CrcB protein
MLQDPNLRQSLAISLGAIAGVLSRYYLTLWFAQRFGINFPYGTFFINLSGCLAMGFFTTWSVEKVAIILPELRLMIATGFLGAYTTFSTYGLESLALIRSGNLLTATGYWLGSAILGILSLHLGVIIAKFFR